MKNGPYTLIVAPQGYPGKKYRNRFAYEHHVKWWKKYGTIPQAGYEIHHKNGNHRDNRINNLQLVTSHEHRVLHGHILKKLAEKKRPKVKCGFCKIKFTKRGNELRQRLKQNNGRIFCGRSCQVKMQWREKNKRRC